MTPNELATAVRDLIQENGGAVCDLSFITESNGSVGKHSYSAMHRQDISEAVPRATFLAAGH